MIGLVIVSHGNLAQEFAAAIDHVLSPQKQIIAVGIHPQDDIEEKRQEIVTAISEVDKGQGVVVMTDMFGGTPSNLAISLLNQKNVEVIAGVNLPMLIKLVSVRDKMPLSQAVIEAQEAGKNYINVASKLLVAHE